MTDRIDIQALLADPKSRFELIKAASKFLNDLAKEDPHLVIQSPQEHAYNPCCPVCRGGDIEGGFIEINSTIATQRVGCGECGAEWVDTYALNGYCDLNIPEGD